jgi:hypothetical protein
MVRSRDAETGSSLGSVHLFAKDSLSAKTFVTVQVINPLCVVLVPPLFKNGVLRQPQGMPQSCPVRQQCCTDGSRVIGYLSIHD